MNTLWAGAEYYERKISYNTVTNSNYNERFITEELSVSTFTSSV